VQARAKGQQENKNKAIANEVVGEAMIEFFFREYYITFKILSDIFVTILATFGLFYLRGIYNELSK
jgi:hypothetical protein